VYQGSAEPKVTQAGQEGWAGGRGVEADGRTEWQGYIDKGQQSPAESVRETKLDRETDISQINEIPSIYRPSVATEPMAQRITQWPRGHKGSWADLAVIVQARRKRDMQSCVVVSARGSQLRVVRFSQRRDGFTRTFDVRGKRCRNPVPRLGIGTSRGTGAKTQRNVVCPGWGPSASRAMVVPMVHLQSSGSDTATMVRRLRREH
jgi:hypothetical protein